MLIWPLAGESVFVDQLFLFSNKCPLLSPFGFAFCIFGAIFMFTPFLTVDQAKQLLKVLEGDRLYAFMRSYLQQVSDAGKLWDF